MADEQGPLALFGAMPFALPPATAAGSQPVSSALHFALVVGLLKVSSPSQGAVLARAHDVAPETHWMDQERRPRRRERGRPQPPCSAACYVLAR
jgi:hypothetical protein